MIHRILSGLLVLLLLAGCQTLSERRQADTLESVLRNYESAIRWGSLEQAHRFQRPTVQNHPAPAAALRVTHYEVVQGPTIVDEHRAIQTALIQYVFVETQVVREVVDQQTWEFDPQAESWYLASPLPRFE